MPLQHIHENMLDRMRRETSQQYIVDLIGESARASRASRCARPSSSAFPAKRRRVSRRCSISSARPSSSGSGVFTYSQRGRHARGQDGRARFPRRSKSSAASCAMAAQHEVAVQVSESFVGRTIKVLVEKKASAKELDRAQVFSWEHGLIREREHDELLGTRGFYRRSRRGGRAGHRRTRLCARSAAAGRICAGENRRAHGLRLDCRTRLTPHWRMRLNPTRHGRTATNRNQSCVCGRSHAPPEWEAGNPKRETGMNLPNKLTLSPIASDRDLSSRSSFPAFHFTRPSRSFYLARPA